MTVKISSLVPHSGTLNISIPAAKLNGTAFSKDIAFSVSGGLPVILNTSYDLTGYNVDLTASGGTNQMNEIYTVTFNQTSSSPTTNKSITITTDYTDIRLAKAYGYFGQRIITAQADSVLLSIFDNNLGGTMHFDNPKMIFTLQNGFGMPISGHLNFFNALNPAGGPPVAISGVPNPLPIPTALVEGQVASNTFILDSLNSNITTALNLNPRFLAYSATATTNVPVPPSGKNFLLDSSQFRVDLEVDLPLHGFAQGLIVQDTADFELDNIEQLQSAIFRINVKNGFPAKAYTQVYFMDSLFTKLDSLISNPTNLVVQSAQTDISGNVIAPTLVTRDEPLTVRDWNIYLMPKRF